MRIWVIGTGGFGGVRTTCTTGRGVVAVGDGYVMAEVHEVADGNLVPWRQSDDRHCRALGRFHS